MTEPFKTPEPSDAAWYAAEKAMEGCPQDESPSRHAIAAGMAIDLPALCRSEVERALCEVEVRTERVTEGFKYRLQVEDYLAARFPEAAPECAHIYPVLDEPCVKCGAPYDIPADFPTPSAGERCKHTKVWKPSGECVDCGTQTGAFLEPCPHGNGVGCPYCIYEDAKKEAGRVPTPSAGEGGNSPPAVTTYTLFHTCSTASTDPFCPACVAHEAVIAKRREVSAGETKQSPFGVSMEELVGARPEEGNAPMVRCDRCGGSYRSDTIHGCLPACTACACERCEAKDAFVRALAKFCAQRYERLSPRLSLAEVCRRDRAVTAAARKVVDG